MSEPTKANPSSSNDNTLFADSSEVNVEPKDSNVNLATEPDTFPQDSPRQDLGNHENEDYVEPPHVNDKGELVDKDGKKVFTTIEESIKDGSMVLDEKGRQPGVYLDDIEREQLDRHRERVEKAFDNSAEGKNSLVERQVNVVNSPLPPVTVHTRQEVPITDQDNSNVVEEDHEPVNTQNRAEAVNEEV